eukprot:1142905-Pelagomonas_calceolata.AAC.5
MTGAACVACTQLCMHAHTRHSPLQERPVAGNASLCRLHIRKDLASPICSVAFFVVFLSLLTLAGKHAIGPGVLEELGIGKERKHRKRQSTLVPHIITATNHVITLFINKRGEYTGLLATKVLADPANFPVKFCL